MLEQLIRQVASSDSLTEEQVLRVVEELVDPSVPVVAKAEFLGQLARKGETILEIAAFARALRAKALQPNMDGADGSQEILDVVGTGGDRMGTFNISTTVALVAAAAGVRVAKHGNRASTSQAGSADVLSALGVPADLGPEEAVRSLREHGFAFFFAQKYHPAFRYIMPARKLCAERGQATIFNFLGPLLNPARPSAMLVGVARPDLCEPVAQVLQSMGVRRAMVVCGAVPEAEGGPRFLDEVSPLGPTQIAEFYQDHGLCYSTLSPDGFPLQAVTLADLRGGDPATNAAIIHGIFNGEDRGPRRDAVLLNSAAALFVAGLSRSLMEGWEHASEVIDSGRAKRKLQDLIASPLPAAA
jgi:anthranilate phosphoribosyltransferase